MTARDGYRSLVFLEDQLAARLVRPGRARRHGAPAGAGPHRPRLRRARQPGRLARARGAARLARLRTVPASTAASRCRCGATATPYVVLNDTRGGQPVARARRGHPGGRDRRRAGQGPALARGRPHPRRRRGPAARHHLPVGRARVRQRRRRPGRRLARRLRADVRRARTTAGRAWTTSGSPYRRSGSTRRSASCARSSTSSPRRSRSSGSRRAGCAAARCDPRAATPGWCVNVEDVRSRLPRAGDHPGGVRLRRPAGPGAAAARARGAADGGAGQLLRRPRRALRPAGRDRGRAPRAPRALRPGR